MSSIIFSVLSKKNGLGISSVISECSLIIRKIPFRCWCEREAKEWKTIQGTSCIRDLSISLLASLAFHLRIRLSLLYVSEIFRRIRVSFFAPLFAFYGYIKFRHVCTCKLDITCTLFYISIYTKIFSQSFCAIYFNLVPIPLRKSSVWRDFRHNAGLLGTVSPDLHRYSSPLTDVDADVSLARHDAD